jgi:hypothetical protein
MMKNIFLPQGYLRIYTGQIKSDTDYKTLRVAQNASTSEVKIKDQMYSNGRGDKSKILNKKL